MNSMEQAHHHLIIRQDGPAKTTKAGITLAIILGTVVGGLSLIFAVMGFWLYMRYRRLKRERAAAQAEDGDAAAPEDDRKSADTMIDYSREIHELNDLSGQRDGKDGSKVAENGNGNGNARTESTAV